LSGDDHTDKHPNNAPDYGHHSELLDDLIVVFTCVGDRHGCTPLKVNLDVRAFYVAVRIKGLIYVKGP
jgi:hypothetical protein